MSTSVENQQQRFEQLARHLNGKLAGHVSLPGEAAYERTVSIWAKPRTVPGVVAHCVNESDVQAAVLAAQEAGVPLSVRGGGHDCAGRSLCEGLTLDLSGMNSVGPIGSTATIEVGGGAKGNDVYAVTDPAGMAPVLGAVADVGVAGVITGGGYGTLIRRFGMACDNLRSATVVLADGRVVRAAEDGDDELFWVIRGGGGNFGVITRMELAIHPVGTVRSGLMLFPFETGADVLPRLEEIWQDAPTELDVQIGIIPGPGDSPVIYLSPTWSGDPDKADAALAPLFAIENRIMSDVRDQPFGTSRTFYDDHIVKGQAVSADTAWLRGWNAEISHIVMESMRRRPSPLCVVLCHDFSGAATRFPSSHTAFARREPHIWFEVIAPTDPNGDSDGSAEATWVHDVVESLSPYSFPGGYPNMLEPHDAERAQIGFGDNAARLIAAKHRYDPDNVFRSAITLPK